MPIDYVYSTRDSLPVKAQKYDTNIFKILKGSLSDDLNHIAMPATLNEPISFLQKMAEYLNYSELLIKAANCKTELETFEYVVAFAVSATSSSYKRLKKPFNPLLFETYELKKDDYSFVSEQVSHHPPISAFHAEHECFVLSGSISPKIKFQNSSLRIIPEGSIELVVKSVHRKREEHFSWNLIKCYVRNFLVGQIWTELLDDMYVVSSNYKTLIKFNSTNDKIFSSPGPPGLNGKQQFYGSLTGCIYEKKLGKPLKVLVGCWVTELVSMDIEDYRKEANMPKVEIKEPAERASKNSLMGFKPWTLSFDTNLSCQDESGDHNNNLLSDIKSILGPVASLKVLWSTKNYLHNSEDYFNFTKFTIGLNDLPKNVPQDKCIEKILPRTDSRFRPDMRMLEYGKIDESESIKHKLEVKQRASHKDKTNQIRPKWFTKVNGSSDEKQSNWKFNNKYFERNFNDCPNIF